MKESVHCATQEEWDFVQKCIKNNWSKFFDCKIDSIYLPL